MESALDPAFLERDRLRKSGIPGKIAETENLSAWETIPSDIPNLYEIWKQGGMVRGTVPVLNTLDEETEFMEAYIRHAYLFYDFGLWTVIGKKTEWTDHRTGRTVCVRTVRRCSGAWLSDRAVISWKGLCTGVWKSDPRLRKKKCWIWKSFMC